MATREEQLKQLGAALQALKGKIGSATPEQRAQISKTLTATQSTINKLSASGGGSSKPSQPSGGTSDAEKRAKLQQLGSALEQLKAKLPNATPEQREQIAATLNQTGETLAKMSGKTYTPPSYTPAAPTATVPSAKDVATGYSPEQSAERISNFSAALNTAIAEARAQRQDQTLDWLGGVIPPGGAPATTFAGVLSAFDNASAPLEASLIRGASDHAINQENLRFEMAETEREQQNQIRDLALSVANAGGSQESVNAILALTDIDDAIGAAAGALQSADKNEIRQVGSNLVRVTDDGSVEVLFSANSGGGGGGGGGNTPSSSTPTSSNPSGINVFGDLDPMQDTAKDLKAQVKKMMAPEIANEIISKLTDEELRLFMQDWLNEQMENRMSIDPAKYFQTWYAALQSTKGSKSSSAQSKDADAMKNQGARTFDGS